MVGIYWDDDDVFGKTVELLMSDLGVVTASCTMNGSSATFH